MQLARWTVALLLAGCAARSRPVETVLGHEVLRTVEVRIPADPYTPLAQALPLLHEIAGRMCGRRYQIDDRHLGRSVESVPVYHPAARVMTTAFVPSYEIVATIRCLRG